MASDNGDVRNGRGSNDPEGISINEIVSSTGSFNRSPYHGSRGSRSNTGSSFASSLLAPASHNEPGGMPLDTTAYLANGTPLLMGFHEQQQQQRQMVPYSPSGVVSIDPPSTGSRSGNEYTGLSISSASSSISRDPPNSTARGLERASHQISATLGEIRAMETIS